MQSKKLSETWFHSDWHSLWKPFYKKVLQGWGSVLHDKFRKENNFTAAALIKSCAPREDAQSASRMRGRKSSLNHWLRTRLSSDEMMPTGPLGLTVTHVSHLTNTWLYWAQAISLSALKLTFTIYFPGCFYLVQMIWCAREVHFSLSRAITFWTSFFIFPWTHLVGDCDTALDNWYVLFSESVRLRGQTLL